MEKKELEEQLEQYQKQFADIFEEYCQIKEHSLEQIEQRYVAVIGIYEYKLNEAKLNFVSLKRKVELIQAAINQMRPVDVKEIDKIVEKELASYHEALTKEFQTVEIATRGGEGTPYAMTKEETQDFKKKYREMVKELHPDIQTDQSDEEQEFYAKVRQAYKNGDYEMMEALEVLFLTKYKKKKTSKTDRSLVQLQNEIDRMRGLIDGVSLDLETMKENYPYTLLAIIDDHEKVEEIRKKILEEQAMVEENYEKLKVKYDALVATLS